MYPVLSCDLKFESLLQKIHITDVSKTLHCSAHCPCCSYDTEFYYIELTINTVRAQGKLATSKEPIKCRPFYNIVLGEGRATATCKVCKMRTIAYLIELITSRSFI